MKKIIHCWEDGPLTDDGFTTTCLLEDGHEGKHEFTSDENIEVTFGSLDENFPS